MSGHGGKQLAEITLTKQAAAHRLIASSIRMANDGEDALARHVVAASAVNLLRELIADRGPNLTEHALQYSFYSQAMARIDGRPTGFENEEAVCAIVDRIVEAINAGQVKSYMDLRVEVSAAEERRMLDSILRPFNFLKHAQRDPLATLNQDDVNPLHALQVAIAAYYFLFPGETMTPDILAFVESEGWTIA